ncbi:MAG: hypothetical protein NC311_10080 [Muribaculaceae bacterium]|nr:hypothetical protein [Muribaculaceae bacterium]
MKDKYEKSAGMTLRQAADKKLGMFAACAVFVLAQDDSDTAPGTLAWEGMDLMRAIAACPELENARIIGYNRYMGEHVFRVRKES